jgi:RNA polymerase sigma-70 factor (ECF subfamily)
LIEPNAREAWTEVEKHLRPFVARRVADPADIGDVLQEIYLRVQAGLPDLRDSERFGPWVYRVARNAVADHLRARARHHPTGARELPGEAAEATVPNDEPDAARELASYLASFVAALPSPYREALILTELQEMNHQDAAQTLGVSLPAMKARVRRGRQQIRQMLEACCDIALDARGRVLSYDRRADGRAPKDCCATDQGCKCQ